MFDKYTAGTIIFIGLIGAPVLFAAAFILEFAICFFTCGSIHLGDPSNPGCAMPIWTGAAFGSTFAVLSIAGIVIGIIYAIAAGTQEGRDKWKNNNEREEKNREQSVNNAFVSVGSVKSKSDNIVSLIKSAEKTIVSPKARKILEEAAIEANKSALALEKAVKIADNAKGKSSKGASKNAQQAEDAARSLQRDVDVANDLYSQAEKEEDNWNCLQQEANDAASKAKKAEDNAVKETAKIEKMTFVSATAKDAAEKAAYAVAKAKEAAAETVKRLEAATRATSSHEARTEVAQAKYSKKIALVEEKIALEEVSIAMANNSLGDCRT